MQLGSFAKIHALADVIYARHCRDESSIMPSQITLNDLAVMVNKGFKEQDKNLAEFKKEMLGFKDEMYGFRDEMYGFRDEMYRFRDETMGRFDRIEMRIDSLERVVINDHGRRLRKIENKLAIA